MLYAGKISGITEYGKLMIPASEAGRVESDSSRYRGKKKTAKKIDAPTKAEAEEPANDEAKPDWTAWVKKRKSTPAKTSGKKRGKKFPGPGSRSE